MQLTHTWISNIINQRYTAVHQQVSGLSYARTRDLMQLSITVDDFDQFD